MRIVRRVELVVNDRLPCHESSNEEGDSDTEPFENLIRVALVKIGIVLFPR